LGSEISGVPEDKMKGMRFASMIRLLLGLISIILWSSVALAQVASGTITGVVQDPSGAVIPGATVTITHVDQGVNYEVTTTSDGLYIRRFLPIGRYSVTVMAPGFKKDTKTDLVLNVGQTMSVDFKMTVGQMSQSIEVKGDATQLLKTESSEVGQVINHTQVEDLPLNGRDFSSLIPLNAGVTPGMQGQSNGGYNYNGSRSDQNMYMLNGVDNIDANNNIISKPSIDAIEEFQVQTGDYSAEFGRTAGGIVQLQLRSGSNKLHGSVFDFLRNNVFDANGYFQNQIPPHAGQNHAPIQPLKQNQYGFTLGGPIKKDKIFFFGDWQGTKTRISGVDVYSVPTAKEAMADFSDTMSAGHPIFYNDLLGQLFPGCSLASFSAACQIVPSAFIDPVAPKVAATYPSPNIPGLFIPNQGTIDNYTASGSTQDNLNSFDVRIDLVATQKDSLSFHYSFGNLNNIIPAAFSDGKSGPCIECGIVLDLLAGKDTGRSQNIGLNYTRSFTPNLVNSLILGVNRSTGFDGTPDGGQNLATQIGMPNININQFTTGLPWFDFAPSPEWAGTSPFEPAANGYTVFQVTDTVSWTHGKNRFKAGLDFRRRRNDGVGNFFGKGAFITEGLYTGNAFADFMSGRYTELEQDLTIGTRGLRGTDLGVYLQDDIKVTPKLTLNLGIRDDFYPGWTEAWNRISNLNLNTGTVELAGQNGSPASFDASYYNNWAPRVGFAYTPGSSGKWVIRGGYGISYENPNAVDSYPDLNAPYTISFTLLNLSFTTFQAIDTLSDGIPPALQPSVASFNTANPAGNWRVIAPKQPIPYVQSYSFGIERALGWNTVLDVSYVGSTSKHLPGEENGDPTMPGPTTDVMQRARFYSTMPNVTGITYYQDGFFSNYNSLQVKLEKRFSAGLQFLTTYTWGKSMDDKSGSAVTGGGDSNPDSMPENPFDERADYGRSSFDVTDKFTTLLNYNLPFGRGQHFGGTWNSVVDGFLGGWQTNAILNISTGLPFSVFATSGVACGCSSTDMRATLKPGAADNGNLPKGQRTPGHWFNMAAFQDPPSSTATAGGGGYGDAARNTIFGPGYANVDFSLFKKFKIKEKVELQFRAEVFNLFNKVNFLYPVSMTNATWTSGGVLTQSQPARIGQGALKIIF
jgi:hypothetical protein